MKGKKRISLLAALVCIFALVFSLGIMSACGNTDNNTTSSNQWYYGAEVPADTLGHEGDYYLNTQTLASYVKSDDGTWTETAANWYYGTEAPVANLGAENDFYLNTESGALYQKKADDWGSPILTLKGEQGKPGRDGVLWYSNKGNPNTLKDKTALAGSYVGDFYLDTESFDVYQKTSDTKWEPLGSIKGRGTTWFDGNLEPDNADLKGVYEGDYYYRTFIDDEAKAEKYQIYRFENKAWTLKADVITADLSALYSRDGESYIQENESGTVTVTGATEGTKNLTVPGTINGKSVEIGENAFRGNQELTSLTLEEGVEGVGDFAFYMCENLTSVTLSEGLDRIGEGAFASSGITEVDLPEGLTEIGTAAFNGTNLTEVSLPSSVTTIGDYAFQYTQLQSIDFSKDEELTSIGNYAFGNADFKNPKNPQNPNTTLKSVDLSKNQKLLKVMQGAFANCTSLAEVTLPTNGAFRAIEGSAFERCTSLASIDIPNGTTFIGSTAFKDCTALDEITLPDTITTIGSDDVLEGTKIYTTEDNWTDGVLYLPGKTVQYLFNVDPDRFAAALTEKGSTKYQIPATTQVIANSAFGQCKTMTEIDIPASVVTIGGGAFVGCEALTTVELHSGLKTMGRLLFQDCKNLQNVTIPDTVTEIGYGTFMSCDQLTSVNIPASVKKIEEGAFYHFKGDVTVAAGNENYTLKTDTNGVKYIVGHENDNTELTKLVWVSHSKALTSFTIPNDVTRVGAFVFAECPDLANIVIPENVTEISYGAFENCAFTSVTLPSGLTLLDGYAFYNCSNLTEIVIPNGVSIIGNYAFQNCIKLQKVTIGSGVMTIGSYAFNGCTDLTSVTFAEGSKIDEIAPYAFGGCTKLKSISLPASLYEVFQNAFNGSGLTELTIEGDGSNMLWLHQDALANCSSLTTIHFGGTEAQWTDLLTRESNFIEKTKGTITVHCSDETVLTYENGALKE